MCTLTWQIRNDRYDLFFNRDELVTRAEALPPAVHNHRVRRIYPTDPEGGGTWIAVNEAGLSACIFNWYSMETIHHLQPQTPDAETFVSRGTIVSAVSRRTSIARAEHFVRDLPLLHYRPFMLLLTEPGSRPRLLRWSGEQLSALQSISPPITTSGIDPERILKRRTQAYQDLGLSKDGNAAASEDQYNQQLLKLMTYHRSRFPDSPGDSVAMKRKEAETVSLTHVAVGNEEICMHYYPGNPGEEAAASHPPHTVCIPADPGQ
ncbi:MAG: NRDE family protein [Spirochaeta sp.]